MPRKLIIRKIAKCFLILVLISLTASGIYAIAVCYKSKQDYYDLKTWDSSPNKNIEGVYTYNTNNSESVRESLYFSGNKYIKIINSGDFYYLHEFGLFEHRNNLIYTQNTKNNIDEYLTVSNCLILNDSFFDGKIPKKNTFDAFFSKTHRDGTISEIQFNKDGTYSRIIDGKSYNGTYEREGYKIFCTSNTFYEEWIVYDSKITNRFFVSDHFSDVYYRERVRYEFCVYIRDYVPEEYSFEEIFGITSFEKNYPISSKK